MFLEQLLMMVRQCLLLLLAVTLCVTSTAGQNTRTKNAGDVPRLTGTISSDDIRKSQEQFFYLLNNTPGLAQSKDVTSTINVLNTPEGQKLMRSLVDSLIPTMGRDDSSELLQNFWSLLSKSVPPKVAKKIKQIEELSGEIDSLPAAFASLVASGDKSPVAMIFHELIPNFNASELLGSLAPAQGELAGASLPTRLLHLVTPAIDSFLKENNIDLQTDAILQIVTSLTSQFQGSGRTKSGKDGGEKTRGGGDPNPLAALLPLLGMMGGGQGKNGNNIMQGLMSMMSNGKNGNNLMEGIMAMMGGEGGGENIMANLFSMMGNGGDKNNLIETVMSMMNGGKSGDSNMMGMMMALMSNMNKNKKQNDNLNMLTSVMELMSAGKGGKENNGMAGLAKLALDMLGKPAKKDSQKQEKKKLYDEKKQYKDDAKEQKITDSKKPVSTTNNEK